MNLSIRSALALASSLVCLSACGPSHTTPDPVDAGEDTSTGSDVPSSSDVPVASDVPVSSDVPVTTDVPVSSDVPVTSDVPTTRDVPTTSDVPVSRDVPVALDVPVSRDVPITIDVPVSRDVPVTIDVPVSRDVPVTTDVPRVGATCGTRGVPPCDAGLYCNHPISAMCGATDIPGRCEVIPTVCTRELNPVCGCDGRDYGNPCNAAAAGVSVAHTGPCAAADSGVVDACAAQDARGVGACARFFGYVWNGSSCVGVSGCSCAGTACDALHDSVSACQAAHPGCDCRALGCPAGRNCQVCRGASGIVYACIPDGAVC